MKNTMNGKDFGLIKVALQGLKFPRAGGNSGNRSYSGGYTPFFQLGLFD